MSNALDELRRRSYRALFQHHPEAAFLFDLEGNFLDCNDAFLAMVDRSREEILTMGFGPFVHPSKVAVTEAGFATAVAGETAEYVSRGVRSDGSVFDVQVTNVPLFDEAGATPIAVMGVAFDIGQVTSLTQAVERNVALLAMAGRISKFAGWAVDLETQALEWTDELFHMVGMPVSSAAPTMDEAMALYPEPYRSMVAGEVQRCIEHGEPMDFDAVMTTVDGVPMRVRVLGEAVRDDAGVISCIRGSIIDLTEVEAERDAWEQRERLLEGAIDRVPDPICFLDRALTITFANVAAAALVEGDAPGLVGAEARRLFGGRLPVDVEKACRAAIEPGTVGRVRALVPAWAKWFDLDVYPTDDGVMLMYRDVTDSVATERAAREAADRDAMQASLFTVSSNAIFTYGADRRILLWNETAAKLYECPIEDAVGRPVDEIILHDGPSLAELSGDVLDRGGSWSGQLTQRTRSGRRIVVDSRVQVILSGPSAGTVMASNTDVTEREAEREAHAQAERLLRETLDQIQDGIFFLDKEWRFTFVNAAGGRNVLRSRDSLLGRVMWEAFPGSYDSVFGRAYRRVLDEQIVQSIREYYEPLARWFEIVAYPTEQGVALYVRDVTVEERNARAIRDAGAHAARQARLLDAARDMILVLTMEGRLLYANESARANFVCGEDGAPTVSGADGASVMNVDADAFADGLEAVRRHGVWDGELVHRLPGGRVMTTDARWQLIDDDATERPSVLAVLTDVTRERERERERQRAQRMESLGTLAGGLAHDLNNVLTPVLMGAQLIADMTDDDDMDALATSIVTSAKRGSAIIRQILTFARGSDGAKSVLDLNDVLRDVEHILAETLPKSVALRITAEERLLVRGDATQLLQVVINLVTNAVDAMPRGGTVAISASRTYSSEEAPDSAADERVVVTVADEGTGMSAETLARIFEPFFTTKDVGQGSGLGLATSSAIVAGHGGTIGVESQPGRGTTFTISLPSGSGQSLPDGEDEGAPPARGTGEVVLVVDDEPAVRDTLRLVLEENGYRAIVATGGGEAIALPDEQVGTVSAVLTDLMMPEVDGTVVADHFRQRHPSIAIIAASGILDQDAVRRASRAGVEHFLPKPFSTDALLRTLRAAIDAKRPDSPPR